MLPFIPLAVFLVSHAVALEPIKSGEMNGLEKRQNAEYCGMDAFGDDLWCVDSSCCSNSDTGIWSCYGSNDQCCETGYTCPNGSQCYLDSFGDQLCVQGSNTVAGGTGTTPQTSQRSSSQPTSTSAAPTPTKSSASAGRVAADTVAKMVSLTWAAILAL